MYGNWVVNWSSASSLSLEGPKRPSFSPVSMSSSSKRRQGELESYASVGASSRLPHRGSSLSREGPGVEGRRAWGLGGISLITNHCRTVSEYPCFHCSASKGCKLSTESLDTLLAKEHVAAKLPAQRLLSPWTPSSTLPLLGPWCAPTCSAANGQPGGKWAKGKERMLKALVTVL